MNEKLYKLALISSWQNDQLDKLVELLPDIDDFRNRSPIFNWDNIVGDTRSKSLSPFSTAAHHVDIEAINQADTVVMVLPAGKNAHMEAGYAMAEGKLVFIVLDESAEPETNYAGADGIFTSIEEFANYYTQMVNGVKSVQE